MMKILAWRLKGRLPCVRTPAMQTLPLTDPELTSWLRLALAPGLNPIALRRLLGTFGLPEAVLSQPFAALAEVTDEATARAALAPPPADFPAQLDAVRA
jgi:DNA processing protein